MSLYHYEVAAAAKSGLAWGLIIGMPDAELV